MPNNPKNERIAVRMLYESEQFSADTKDGYVCEWGDCIDKDVPAQFELTLIFPQDILKTDYAYACEMHLRHLLAGMTEQGIIDEIRD